MSLEGFTVSGDESTFWKSFGDRILDNFDTSNTPDTAKMKNTLKAIEGITSSGHFLSAFRGGGWSSGEKIVMIIDEFDEIFNARDSVRDSCLSAFRVVRQINDLYAIDSIIACGTFSLLHLTTSNLRVSPFNVNYSIRNPYFSFEDTQTLFKEYAQDEGIEIDERIVREIFHNSNGYVQPWSSVLYCYGLSTLIVSIMAPPVQLQ